MHFESGVWHRIVAVEIDAPLLAPSLIRRVTIEEVENPSTESVIKIAATTAIQSFAIMIGGSISDGLC